jgi:hypothetical protein
MLKDPKHRSHIVHGNSFSRDGHAGRTFDYLIANPPFGVEWKKVRDAVEGEARTLGFAGRFGAGLPRINDGSLLILQHMISKMKPVGEGGSRVAIVFNGSPLFTGAAVSRSVPTSYAPCPTRSTYRPPTGSGGGRTSCAPLVAGARCATAVQSPSTFTIARTKGLAKS